MRFDLQWMAPISLKDGGDQNLIYTCDRSDLPEEPGIYIFGRRHGSSFEALYVGKASSVQNRVREQFKNLPLMKHVEGAKNCERILLVGRFVAHRGQQPDNFLSGGEMGELLLRNRGRRGQEAEVDHLLCPSLGFTVAAEEAPRHPSGGQAGSC